MTKGKMEIVGLWFNDLLKNLRLYTWSVTLSNSQYAVLTKLENYIIILYRLEKIRNKLEEIYAITCDT